MKYLFLVVIATGLIFATSCKKEEVPETNSGIKSSNTVMDFNLKAAEGRYFYDNGGESYGCKAPPVACSGTDAQVKPADKDKVNDVFNTIETGEQDAIIKSFQNNYNMLLNYLPKKAVNGVINKTYTVKSRGKELEEKGRFMLFYNGEGTRVYVRPFFAL